MSGPTDNETGAVSAAEQLSESLIQALSGANEKRTSAISKFRMVPNKEEKNKIKQFHALKRDFCDELDKLSLYGCLLYTSPSPRDA